MKIEWAPLNIPLRRRLQTLAALISVTAILSLQILSIYFFVKLLYSDYYIIGLIYLWWMLYDIDKSNHGGRSNNWVRDWTWWYYFKDYFPASLIKTVDLNPNENYLFACFPHGVMCIGPFNSFATNALGFSKLFPGMTSHLVTLRGHFCVPFFRELALSLGGLTSAMESLLYALDRNNGVGKCVCLMVGGSAESLFALPGVNTLVINRRKGFLKAALTSGSALVPVYTFNETSLFRPIPNPEGSLLRKLQEFICKKTGIAPMFPIGRGIFQYTLGILLLRTPIYTVVGKPIKVEQTFNPTDEQIDQLREVFKEKLTELFENEKHKYIKDYQNERLIFV